MLFFAINGDKNLTNLCQKKITIITPNNNKNNTIKNININNINVFIIHLFNSHGIVFIIKWLVVSN